MQAPKVNVLLTEKQYKQISKKIFTNKLDSEVFSYQELFHYLNQVIGYIRSSFESCQSEFIDPNAKKGESPLIEEFYLESFSYVLDEADLISEITEVIQLQLFAKVHLSLDSKSSFTHQKNYIDSMMAFLSKHDVSDVILTLKNYQVDLLSKNPDYMIEITEAISNTITSFVSILESLNLNK